MFEINLKPTPPKQNKIICSGTHEKSRMETNTHKSCEKTKRKQQKRAQQSARGPSSLFLKASLRHPCFVEWAGMAPKRTSYTYGPRDSDPSSIFYTPSVLKYKMF
jgi:hypothetical protein